MNARFATLAAGLLTAVLALGACSADDGGGSGSDKPNSSAKGGGDGDMSSIEREAFLAALKATGIKPKGVGEDAIVDSVSGVCAAKKKGEKAMVAEEKKVAKELKVSEVEAAGVVGAAGGTC